MSSTRSGSIEITYDAALEMLAGRIGDWSFRFKAFSGGGRGSTNPARREQTPASRSMTTAMISDRIGERGGTLPNGAYVCHYLPTHRLFGPCIFLNRTASSAAIHTPAHGLPIPHGRGNDFFIHKRGPKGSDGCIVPEFDHDRGRLNAAVRDSTRPVVLIVRGATWNGILPVQHAPGRLA